MTLERKYGDSLNFEDLNGYPGKPKKKKTVEEASATVTATADVTKTILNTTAEGVASQPTVGGITKDQTID